MKKQLLSQLEKLEKKSSTLNADERFQNWLSRHYPAKNLQLFDYMEIMRQIPPEFQESCLDRIFATIAELQRHASTRKLDVKNPKDCV